ncbi:MAG: hypothetical protein J7M38_00375, partial [Armatimonadetes bacterium]|nr:hypothetical protein [Armatimonadota bacterium]
MSDVEMPDIWGDGKLFCFSGLDGETSWAHTFVGSASLHPFGIIIRTDPELTLRFGGDVLS